MLNLTGKVDAAGPPTGQLPAAEWNDLAQELVNLLSHASLTPSGADPIQIAKSIAQLVSLTDYYVGGGTGNAQTLAVVSGTRPGATAYATGLRIRWVPSASNTGAATVNVNGLGAKSVKRFDGGALQANDILSGRVAEAYYHTSGEFRLTPGSIPASTAALPASFITGLICGRNVADPSHDIIVSTGSCRDATNAVNLVLASPITKAFDGSPIAYGTGQTGFPTLTHAARAASTWYRVFIVGHTDGRTDVGFDTSATAAFLRADLATVDSAGWNYYRQIGWVRTTSGSASTLRTFSQNAAQPNQFNWVANDTRVDVDRDLDTLTTRQTISLADVCPPGCVAHVVVLIEDHSGSGTTSRYGVLSDKSHADVAPDASNHNVATRTAPGAFQGGWTGAGSAEVEVDASSEFYERWSAGGAIERSLLVPRFYFAR